MVDFTKEESFREFRDRVENDGAFLKYETGFIGFGRLKLFPDLTILRIDTKKASTEIEITEDELKSISGFFKNLEI